MPPEFMLDNTITEILLTEGLELGKVGQIKVTFSEKYQKTFKAGATVCSTNLKT